MEWVERNNRVVRALGGPECFSKIRIRIVSSNVISVGLVQAF
jgi:hypothetical protein